MIGATRCIALATVLLAGLSTWAQTPPSTIDVADAVHFEGHRVQVTGLLEPQAAGPHWRGVVYQEGHALEVWSYEPLEPGPAVLVGRLARLDGRLALVADVATPWTS